MSKKAQLAKLLAVAGFTLAAVLQVGPMAIAENPKWDFSKPAIYTLDRCTSDAELDCIESVGIITDDDVYHPAIFKAHEVSGPTIDGLGNSNITGQEVWTVEIDGQPQELRVSPNMETASHACCKFPDGSIKRFGAIRTIIGGLTGTQRIRFVLRTSWIKPLDVPMYASRASFKEEKIAGGRKWTFTGANMTSYGYEDNASGTISQKLSAMTARADWERVGLYFTIDHAGINDELSAFPQTCSDSGYTAQASNATSAGMPSWNAQTQSLDFAIGAPHLTTTGELNKGFFQFWAKVDYMNCKWPGNTLAESSRFSVSVTDETGNSESVEVSAAGITDGVFHLIVEGLHFSSPSIRVKPVVEQSPKPSVSPIPSQSPSASPSPSQSSQPQAVSKMATITCVKGKLAKKVTAVSPKCPAGYKKK